MINKNLIYTFGIFGVFLVVSCSGDFLSIIPSKLEDDFTIDVDSFYDKSDDFRNFITSIDSTGLDSIPDWENTFVYKDIGWKKLEIKMYSGKSTSEKKPSILFFHGGGWKHRELNQHKQYAYYFSQEGYNTFSIEYRILQDSTIVTPYDALEDTKSAFSYLRKNAQEYQLNAEKMIGTGMSAGGQLVAAAAYINMDNNQYSSKPNALILQNAVIDLSENGWPFGHEYLGESWESLSPLHQIADCQNIPSLLLSGTLDRQAPMNGMEEWDSIYESKNCKNYLYAFKGRKHGFSNYSSKRSGENHRDFYYSIYLMQNFLLDNDFN